MRTFNKGYIRQLVEAALSRQRVNSLADVTNLVLAKFEEDSDNFERLLNGADQDVQVSASYNVPNLRWMRTVTLTRKNDEKGNVVIDIYMDGTIIKSFYFAADEQEVDVYVSLDMKVPESKLQEVMDMLTNKGVEYVEGEVQCTSIRFIKPHMVMCKSLEGDESDDAAFGTRFHYKNKTEEDK
ncbi:hypothetical protein GR7B_00023 [Vibrio phage vB_VcorM_GR7B]|nr:hypothetical protein GR7B_00023 [Vibrio phage vB_VcorM_GR7B]